MKKIALILVSMFFITTLMAHAPSSIKLSYNKTGGKLNIEVVHKVNNTESHYIDEITIWVNNTEIETIAPGSQSSKERHILEYEIGALASGDIVKVMANCNKMGKKTVQLIIK